MSSLEVGKIGQWDEHSLKKALRHLPAEVDDDARSLIMQLLHFDPDYRFTDMRQVLEHPFFSSAKSSRPSTTTPVESRENMTVEPVQRSKAYNAPQDFSKTIMEVPQPTSTQSLSSSSPSVGGGSTNSRSKMSLSRGAQLDYVDENSVNGTSGNNPVSDKLNDSVDMSSVTSSVSKRSRKFGSIRNPFGKSKRQALKK